MTTRTQDTESGLSMIVAGEDLRTGDFVATFAETHEVPSFMWDRADVALAPDDLVRLTVRPADAGRPLKIVGVSLPFVYVETSRGSLKTIDTRRTQLVRLARRCAKKVWKRMKSARGTSRSRR